MGPTLFHRLPPPCRRLDVDLYGFRRFVYDPRHLPKPSITQPAYTYRIHRFDGREIFSCRWRPPEAFGQSADHGKGGKSNVTTKKVLVFAFISSSRVFENSRAVFESLPSLLVLLTDYIAFNPALACIKGNWLRSAVAQVTVLFAVNEPVLTIILIKTICRGRGRWFKRNLLLTIY